MWNKIKKLFSKDDVAVQLVKELAKKVDEQQALLEQRTRELEELKTKEQAREHKQTSKEPWVLLSGADYKDNEGFKIELDWNPAFIQQLKENGIDGPTDEIIIQKWLAFLYDDVVNRLDAQQQEAKERSGTISDFAK